MIPRGKPGAVELDRNRAAYLPLRYYEDFLRLVREYEDLVSVVTYRQLPWGDDYAHEEGYPGEWKNWREQCPANRVTILIQHDVDSSPERSWLAGRREEELGVPSTFMMFHRRIDRKRYEAEGELVLTNYEVDEELLGRLCGKGWGVGYHSNALDMALFDDDKAREIFVRDVGALRKKYEVGYFSAHGGLRSPEGRTNNQLRPPDLKGLGLRWVHNGATPKFDGHWSDGGLNGHRIDPESRDLRHFLVRMKKGKRYRILTHPQYYDRKFDASESPLGKTVWYREIEKLYREGRGSEAWNGVRCAWDELRSTGGSRWRGEEFFEKVTNRWGKWRHKR